MEYSCPCIQLHNMQTNGKYLNELEPLGQSILYAIYLEEIVNATDEFDFLIEGSENLSLLSEHWNAFWCAKGEELVLKTWIAKYKDYLDSSYEFQAELPIAAVSDCGKSDTEAITEISSDESCYCALIELNKILTICDTELQNIAGTSDLKIDDWDSLWENHHSNQYKLHFKIFSEICSSLAEISKINVKHRRSTCIRNQKSYESCEEYVSDDCNVQLMALGLPTSFGKKRKKRFGMRFNASVYSEDFPKSCDNSPNSLALSEKRNISTEPSNDQEVKAVEVDKKERENASTVLEQLACNSQEPAYLPPEILNDKTLLKYWKKRFSLFSRFDEGIKLDKESWFSVTPEKIGRHIAKRLKCAIIVDAFCGSGGNSIQFAFTCDKVIAVDIDPVKISLAKHNAKIYGVEKKIEFIVADFLHIYHNLRADVVFLSPPWGGPSYLKSNLYDIERDMSPLPASRLLDICRKITLNISLYLPRNSDIQKLLKTTCEGGSKVEVENNFLNGRVIALTVYYGNLVKSSNE